MVTTSTSTNVRDFGAVGDGVTDDAAHIQHTIDTSPNGANIYFPAGTYMISTPLSLKFGQHYSGDTFTYGSSVGGGFVGGSIIKQMNGKNLVALMAVDEYLNGGTTSSNPIVVSNLFFDGNVANNNKPPAHGGHGLVLLSSFSVIRECWFANMPQCAVVIADENANGVGCSNSCVENRIERCRIENAGKYGIWVQDNTGQCTDGYIRDCVVDTSQDTAMQLDRGAGWFLSGNHVYGCQLSGIIVQKASAASIIGNEVDGYGYAVPHGGYVSGIEVHCSDAVPVIVDSNIVFTSEANSANVGNDNAFYYHLSIIGEAQSDSTCLVTNNGLYGGYVNTIGLTSVNPSTSVQAIVVASTTNILPGKSLSIDSGPNREVVVVKSVIPSATGSNNQITAVFSKAHKSPYAITSAKSANYSIGIMIQTFTTQLLSQKPFNVQVALNRVDGSGQAYATDGSPNNNLLPIRFLKDMQADGNVSMGGHILAIGPNAVTTAGSHNSFVLPTLVGNDVRGVISFTAATVTVGEQVNVVFTAPYATQPVVTIAPQNGQTSSFTGWYVSDVSTTGFSISAYAALPATKSAYVLSFAYHVIG